jgi:hypothetical protein
MNKVARLPAAERRDLFQESARERGTNPAIIEKDFWVCWVLKQLFADPELGARLVFKGGTTLSKVFGVIDRFSEDIDLVLDWQLLGYGPGQQDPYQDFESKGKQDRFNKSINRKAADYIAGTLTPNLQRLFANCPEIRVSVDTTDPNALNVAYPAAFSEDYLRPEVRLEIGPLASWVPSNRHVIQPYAADAFPKVFEDPACPVVAITAERTFWEKATILHQEAHRAGVMPSRHSRHYYDMFKLATSSIRRRALEDLELLRQVVEFKQRFYPSGWARYEDAKPGTFRLIPDAGRHSALRRDYRDMEMMIFGETPKFDTVIDSLKELEDEINGH